MIPLAPLLALGSLGAFVYYFRSNDEPTPTEVVPPERQLPGPVRKPWSAHPDVARVLEHDDRLVFETISGLPPAGLPKTDPEGRPVWVTRHREGEDSPVNPFISIVTEIQHRLGEEIPGQHEFKSGFNIFKQHSVATIGAPAPAVATVRRIVDDAISRYGDKAGVRVEEGRSSPGAIGEGWHITLTEIG